MRDRRKVAGITPFSSSAVLCYVQQFCICYSPPVLLGGTEEGFFGGGNCVQPSTLLLPLLIRRNKGEVGWVIAAATTTGRLGSSTCCDLSLQPLFSILGGIKEGLFGGGECTALPML
ncbi:unnamed protein product [Musa banksii]